METINVTNARAKLYKLVSDVSKSHEPIQITSKEGDAVLLSKDDWDDIQETLYLYGVPGMAASILDGMNAQREELISEDDFDFDV